MPTLVFDAGDLISRDMRIPEGAAPAREAKGDLILKAVAHTGIDAMTIGDGELAFGLPWLQERVTQLELPVVCANLQDAEGQAVFPATKVIETGEMKIGVFGITGNINECEGCTVTDATEAATAAVAELKEEGCHLIIGLSHQGVEDDAALAEAVEGIDFIVAAHTRRRQEFPRVAGTAPTYITQSGSRGRSVGKISITFVEGGRGFYDESLAGKVQQRKDQVESRVASLEKQIEEATTDRERQRYERSLERTKANAEEMKVADVTPDGKHTMTVDAITLSKNIADDPEIKTMVAEAKSTMPEEPRHKGRGDMSRRKQIGQFTGSSGCRRCHPQAYKQWRQTGHSNAYTTLVREQKHDDDKCFGCHITGFFAEGGPRTTREVSYLRNVQCESCHGASAKHVENPKVATPNKGKATETCTNCHNEKAHAGEAPPFELASALEKVKCEDTPVDPATVVRGRPKPPVDAAGGAPTFIAPSGGTAVKPKTTD